MNMRRKHSFLIGRFGMEALFPLHHDQLEYIKQHYGVYVPHHSFRLDDRTWNDVDLDQVCIDMDSTYSSAGNFMLYGMLRTPCLDLKTLKLRQDIMNWANTQEDERDSIIQILYTVGRRKEDMDRVMSCDNGNLNRKRLSIILAISFILSLLLSIFFPKTFIIVSIIILLINIMRATMIHKQLEHEVNALVHILAHVDALHAFAKQSFTGLSSLKEEILNISKSLKDLQMGHSLDYFENSLHGLNFLFQSESIYYDRYATTIYQKRDEVRRAIALVGKVDACIATASYVAYKNFNTNIQLHESKKAIMKAEQMVHPLMQDAVPNDIDILENRIITGSNATGKSTYLKMVALNAILAQTFHFVSAEDYDASFFQIATSMSVQDSLFDHESTFVAEVNSLRYLINLEQDVPTLCMIDEILRGTNTQERIASSCVILKMIAQHNFRCICATHDMELTKILPSFYANYHFRETMKEGKMTFDYKIHKGFSKTRNAISLLSILGYQNSLIQHAEERLSQFETTGNWDIIE